MTPAPESPIIHPSDLTPGTIVRIVGADGERWGQHLIATNEPNPDDPCEWTLTLIGDPEN